MNEMKLLGNNELQLEIQILKNQILLLENERDCMKIEVDRLSASVYVLIDKLTLAENEITRMSTIKSRNEAALQLMKRNHR